MQMSTLKKMLMMCIGWWFQTHAFRITSIHQSISSLLQFFPERCDHHHSRKSGQKLPTPNYLDKVYYFTKLKYGDFLK